MLFIVTSAFLKFVGVQAAVFNNDYANHQCKFLYKEPFQASKSYTEIWG